MEHYNFLSLFTEQSLTFWGSNVLGLCGSQGNHEWKCQWK